MNGQIAYVQTPISLKAVRALIKLGYVVVIKR